MIISLISTERLYINYMIYIYFNKPIENTSYSNFNKNICHLCDKSIIKKTVRNHCHYSGQMLGYAHNRCNLPYKYKKDNHANEFIIDCLAHNSQNFDQSFLIKALQYLDSKIPFSCLPRNSNKFISIQIANFIFKDSYLFLDKSLDYLTKTINDKDRISLKEEFGNKYNLLTKKGIYPCDYFDCIDKYKKNYLILKNVLI